MAEHPDLQSRTTSRRNNAPIDEDAVHALLEHYCNSNLGVLSQDECQIVIGLGTRSAPGEGGMSPDEIWAWNPLFGGVHDDSADKAVDQERQRAGAEAGQRAAVDHALLLMQADSTEQALSSAMEAIAGQVAGVLTLARDEVEPERALHAFGVDSLLALELSNWLSRTFEFDVPVVEVLGGQTSVSKLAEGLLTAIRNFSREFFLAHSFYNSCTISTSIVVNIYASDHVSKTIEFTLPRSPGAYHNLSLHRLYPVLVNKSLLSVV